MVGFSFGFSDIKILNLFRISAIRVGFDLFFKFEEPFTDTNLSVTSDFLTTVDLIIVEAMLLATSNEGAAASRRRCRGIRKIFVAGASLKYNIYFSTFIN